MKRLLHFLLGILVLQSVQGQEVTKAPLLENLKIAFVSYRTGSAEVFLMNSDGSGMEQLTNSPDRNSFPFQIDERTLGFTRIDTSNKSTKFKIDIYTKKEEVIEENPIRKSAKWEAYSSDSSHVAFIRSSDYSDRELFIYNGNTGIEKQLTSQKYEPFFAYSINHSWSPDGKKLIFMSGADWYTQYVRMYDLEKDSIIQVTRRGYMNSGLNWLTDGKTLIANLKIKDETLYELYQIDITTGKVTQITEGINLHPNVSPDGQWVVFESQRHQNEGEVYIMKPDGSQQFRLTNNPNYNGRCIWFRLK